MQKKLKWCRASPIIKPDNIISSKARATNDHGFIPTYEKERYNMCFIMSNEYMRKWFQERDVYFKKTAKNRSINVIDQSCKRRYINRQSSCKSTTPKPLPIIQLKQFKHLFVPKEIEVPTKIRYKPDCSLYQKTERKSNEHLDENP